MIASSYPFLDIFWTMLEFFLLVIYIWLLIAIFSDIFRSPDMGGGTKMLWVLFVFIIPLLGILAYLIARGGKMHERAATATQAKQRQAAFDAQVTHAAGANSTDQLARLADFKSQGILTDAEFEAEKEKLLS